MDKCGIPNPFGRAASMSCQSETYVLFCALARTTRRDWQVGWQGSGTFWRTNQTAFDAPAKVKRSRFWAPSSTVESKFQTLWWRNATAYTRRSNSLTLLRTNTPPGSKRIQTTGAWHGWFCEWNPGFKEKSDLLMEVQGAGKKAPTKLITHIPESWTSATASRLLLW